MESSNNYINHEDFTTILNYIPNLKIRKWDDTDIKFLFKILRYCALRPMEGITLSKEDFIINDRKIKLGKTKTDPNAEGIIPRSFLPELEVYLNWKDTGRLFKGLTYHPFYDWCKRMGKELEIEAWNTPQSTTREKTVGHIGRKSIGKDMIYGEVLDFENNKVEIPIISKFLRHGSVAVTLDSYLKANIETVRQTL